MNTTPLQVRNAYRAGWNASAKIDGPSLDAAEDTYLRRGRTDAQHDAWLAGWLDYAADNAYGTALEETPATAAVAPIVVDSTPAGIYAAMMRANASESAAPQSRLYGLLSDYLRRSLVKAYGIDADKVYDAIVSSGECSDYVIDDTLADAAYMRGQRGGRNYFVTVPSAIAYELRHVLQISRDWRAGLREFATVGQHGSGYWTVTQGHTASGRMMERTDEPMVITCVTRFADSRQAQAAIFTNGYR